ncbi:MAG TPA: CRISPR-associated endoribonuclease Cas6 [Blastocatellia bacterium]|nr:CRISPR-associated endoribonuclease Cas6 [Blastocatellia bacterium]
MRIEVDLFSERQITLPWNYLDWLQGIFYRAMERGIPRLAREVHDEGFFGGGKRYKLATFSLLYPERYEKVTDGIRTQGIIRWWIASPLEPLIEALALGLLAAPEVQLGKEKVHVGQIGVALPPTFTETMTFTTLSPIFVSTGERDATGQLRKRFLSPKEPDFARVLGDNLRRKAQALLGEVPEGELRFEWLGEPKSKLMRVKETDVRGWMMRFRVSGPVELLQLGYDAGFGERNAQGFGMVGLLQEHPAISQKVS